MEKKVLKFDKSRIYRLGTLPSKTPCGFYVSIFVYWSKIPWGEKMGSAMGIKVGWYTLLKIDSTII